MKHKLARQIVTREAVSSSKGAVAAARLANSAAAAEMLERGGNAVDAGIAAALVAGVVEPMETTLAGSGFMLVSRPGEAPVSIEFGPVAPKAAHANMYELDNARRFDRGLGVSVVVDDANISGPKAWGIPGVIGGLFEAHSRYGVLPWKDVVQPAIRAATDGFPVDNYFALEALGKLDHLRRDKGASSIFLVDGVPPAPAHLGNTTLGVDPKLKQPALARTLERIAEKGGSEFYTGETADLLAETAKEYGAFLAREDLAGYKPHVTKARHLRFRDVDIWAPTAPSAAVTQFQMLNAWQQLFPKAPVSLTTPDSIKAMAEICWHAFADRYHWLGDPKFSPVPEEGLLSTAYASHIAGLVRDGAPAPRSEDGPPWEVFANKAVHDPWAFQSDQKPRQAWAPEGATESLGGTTHVSAVDSAGMAVSITYTAADHFGSKVVCPRTGLLMDAAMGWFNARAGSPNSISPGKRPLTNMAPLILTRNDKAFATIGAPGGRRIVHAIMQIVLSLVEQKLSAADAVAAPRIDASGSTLLISERLAEAGKALDAQGIPVKLVNEQHEPFGYEMARPLVIAQTEKGEWMPSIDPFTKGYGLAIA